jgi:beta-mannosidase
VHEEITLPLNLINESGGEISDITARLEIYDYALRKIMEKIYVRNIPGESFLTAIDKVNFIIPENFRDHFFFVRAALYRDGLQLNQSIYWPKCLSIMDDEAFCNKYRASPQENMVFRKGPWLKEEIKKAGKALLSAEYHKIAFNAESCRHCFSIRLSNDSPHAAFPVRLMITDHGCVHLVSDNFFFMAAGEARELRLDIFDRTGNLDRFCLDISAWNGDPIQLSLNSPQRDL